MLMTSTAYGRKDWMTLKVDLHCRVIRDFKIQRRGRQREHQKNQLV